MMLALIHNDLIFPVFFRDDSFEQLTHLGVHTLDGDPKHINLLKYALRYIPTNRRQD